MKTLLRSLLAAAMAVTAPLASASLYEGTWTNTTFSSSGELIIELNISGNKVAGSFDLNGNVFGSVDPDPIPFKATLDSNGNGSFTKNDPKLGKIDVTFDAAGKLDILITEIPAGLDEVRVDGKFDLKLETFEGTYAIDASPGILLAEGTLEAHVRKAPAIQVKKTVKFSGKKAKATVKVTSNVAITSAKAKAGKGAKAKLVKKGGQYILKVSKLKAAGSKVKVTITNADGLVATKNIRFKKR